MKRPRTGPSAAMITGVLFLLVVAGLTLAFPQQAVTWIVLSALLEVPLVVLAP